MHAIRLAKFASVYINSVINPSLDSWNSKLKFHVWAKTLLLVEVFTTIFLLVFPSSRGFGTLLLLLLSSFDLNSNFGYFQIMLN